MSNDCEKFFIDKELLKRQLEAEGLNVSQIDMDLALEYEIAQRDILINQIVRHREM